LNYKTHNANCEKNIITNSFFPFEWKNSQVFYGVRINNESYNKEKIVLFKGTGDQIVPSQASTIDKNIQKPNNLCVFK
jgi:hypothetical protein